MQAVATPELKSVAQSLKPVDYMNLINTSIKNSWARIAPFWPLKNLIAVNPLAGFEDVPFQDALKQAQAYFQHKTMPEAMQHVNRESIKWLQAFFDNGQSTIQMPLRQHGLLKSVISLLHFDNRLDIKNAQKHKFLATLPQEPENLIAECLLYLGIPTKKYELFLTLMLTTLPGWAAYVKYRTEWADAHDAKHPYPVTQAEYIALRLVLTCLIWPAAKDLLAWHEDVLQQAEVKYLYSQIQSTETSYRKKLLPMLNKQILLEEKTRPNAQMVFCIDVRSEPFRRALEAQGNYETYGFAGFFGVPIAVENTVTGESYASCPVLLKPAYNILEQPCCPDKKSYDTSFSTFISHGYKRLQSVKKLYQAIKYTFTTPFSLVEAIGFSSGLWMLMRNMAPRVAIALKKKLQAALHPEYAVSPTTENIPFEQQLGYGLGALKMMGLTDNFAPVIVFCGHGSTTQNNAYATALDCGACGGRHGAPNARVLAKILNTPKIREVLKTHKIYIPEDTHFLAAEHNTTTDIVTIYDNQFPSALEKHIIALKQALEAARSINSLKRSADMGLDISCSKVAKRRMAMRAQDWAEVRPEWGLARNAAFIIGPRWLTKNINLEGRAFLHSYEWQQDHDATLLTTILTAPMVVAQWINAQYLFSTVDNVAFGGGSKITKNITGKIGVMQGNASDLMHGLPLQSVYRSDIEAYHKAMRLTVIVYAPRVQLDLVIKQQAILQKLFGNCWVNLCCHEPVTNEHYVLTRDLTWVSA